MRRGGLTGGARAFVDGAVGANIVVDNDVVAGLVVGGHVAVAVAVAFRFAVLDVDRPHRGFNGVAAAVNENVAAAAGEGVILEPLGYRALRFGSHPP